MEVALQENLYLPPFENTHEDKNTAFFDETSFWFFKQEADMMIPLVLAASLCHFYTKTTHRFFLNWCRALYNDISINFNLTLLLKTIKKEREVEEGEEVKKSEAEWKRIQLGGIQLSFCLDINTLAKFVFITQHMYLYESEYTSREM